MQLELEVEAKHSEERERKLVQRALEGERRTADAMRAEATAAEEAAAAERAAKYAANSEARELQREMEGLQESLRCDLSVFFEFLNFRRKGSCDRGMGLFLTTCIGGMLCHPLRIRISSNPICA